MKHFLSRGYPKPLRLMACLIAMIAAISTMAQNQIQVTGTVVDNNGEPVIGATIWEKGTKNNRVVTGLDGDFTIRTKSDATIAVSCVGFTTKEVKVTTAPMHIVISEDAKMLEDMVVIGYGSISKKEVTSAVSHVSSKDMLQIGSSNPAMQMQGKVSGLTIDNTASSDPNHSPGIQIRGVSSRSAGLGPLIVIDGVPGGSLDNVNENDIESIDVLKDGAASAIYGTRGSNGVIVVTTKKGSTDGQVHATYSGYVNFATPKREFDVLSADEFRRHERGEDYGANTDWFDEITRTGISHSHTVQISGGNAKNNYRGTVDYKNMEGVDIRSSKEEIGGRLTMKHTGKNELYSITLNAAPRLIKYRNGDYSAFNAALYINPTTPVMDAENPGKYTYITTYSTNNPVEALKLEKSKGERLMLNWDGTFKLNLLPLFAPTSGHTLNTQITLAQQIIDNDYTWFRPAASTVSNKTGFKGEARRTYDRNKQNSLEWIVNYGFDNQDHHVKFMGGYSYQYFVNDGFAAENKDFSSDLLGADNLGAGTYNSVATGRLGMSSYKNDAKLIAFFGRASYNFRDRYFATASLRYEGSSKFGKDHKWGYFPALSAGWRISQEDFMKDVDWIDELKIRGDYGETGNQDFASYMSLSTMAGYQLVYFNGQYIQEWGFDKNPNPDLHWEKGKNWNVGIDFSLFDNILSGSINYYSRQQQDLLGYYNVSLPPNANSTTFLNVGTMQNRGVEFELTVNAVRSKDFTYTTTLIGSTSDNKFKSFSNSTHKGQSFYWLSNFPLYPGNPGPLQRIEEGERVGNFYTFKYAGVDEKGNWLIESKDGEPIPIDKGTDEDKRVVGNGLPKFSLSWNNFLKYRNFDLTLFFRGNFGFQVYDSMDLYYGLQSAAPNTNVLTSAYGKNNHVTSGTNVHSSYFVHDGDFLKLDVVTLGYNWNINSKWIDNLRVYFTARNLFTIGGHKGLDMDAYAVNGLEPGVAGDKINYYPASREYLIGVQFNF